MYIQHSKDPDQTGLLSVRSHSSHKKDIVIRCSEAKTTICLCRHLCVKAVKTRVWNSLVTCTVCACEELKYIRLDTIPNLFLFLEMQIGESGTHKLKASISRTWGNT